jgi:hypothetical protein
MSPALSGFEECSKQETSMKQATRKLFFNPEDGRDMFFRKVS